MKKLLVFVLGLSMVFLFSCKTKEIASEESKYLIGPDIVVFKTDTFEIKPDVIYVNTNKELKKVNESERIIQDSVSVEFVGNTEIQKAISSNTEIPANAGIGVRFTKKYGSPTSILGIDKLELDLSVSVASNVDTIKAIVNTNNEITNVNAFGNSILMPLNSGQSVMLNIRTFMNNRKTRNTVIFQNWGIQGYAGASNRVWNYQNDSQDVSTIAINVGLFTELMPFNNMDEFSISGGLDIATRWIFGNAGHDYATDFRKSIIGTDKIFFLGFEPNLTIRLRDIKASATLPILFSFENNDVPGLTKGQFMTMIRFTGGFPLSLGKN